MTIPYVDGKEPSLSEREQVLLWITNERRNYADLKYSDDGENRNTLIEAMQDGDWQRWLDFTGNYMMRAKLFGFDTLQGRQALGKSIVTLMHTLETAIELFGDMPKPGVSSTDGVQVWE